MSCLKHAIRFTQVLENGLLITLFAIMILTAFFQIGGRVFFSSGFPWADSFIYHLILWTGLMGAAVATREKKHINIDIFNRLLPSRYQHLTGSVTNLFSFFICGVLTYASVRFIIDEHQYPNDAIGHLPTWLAGIPIPVFFLTVSIRFIIYSIQDLVLFYRKTP